MTTIKGKTIILTGASRGIGALIARELAKKQATIICVSRSQSALERICTEIDDLGGKGIGVVFDVSKVERMPELMYEIKQLTGSFNVDILVNNAGIEIYRSFKNYSLQDIQLVLSVNLISAIELTRLVLPNMLKKGSGHIVNIASFATQKGHPYDSIYSASKAGLLMWADALRDELAPTNIIVSNISPGYSQQKLFADVNMSAAPVTEDISTPQNVATAVYQAIENNGSQIVVNENFFTRNMTKLKFAVEQFLPKFGDAENQSADVNNLHHLNKMSNKSQDNSKEKLVINETEQSKKSI
ncbi:MAG: SDR family oxidoreductase [Cyanobacteriota bacterium]|nr:SDR family oxidoreductase [Cyanobacteriota bacterium]